MSELMTNAKEAYLDLKMALHGIIPSGDTVISDKLNVAFERAWDMYLICEQQEKRIEELEKRRDVNPNCGGACRGDSHETDRG